MIAGGALSVHKNVGTSMTSGERSDVDWANKSGV